jgi:hypothetical protein
LYGVKTNAEVFVKAKKNQGKWIIIKEQAAVVGVDRPIDCL